MKHLEKLSIYADRLEKLADNIEGLERDLQEAIELLKQSKTSPEPALMIDGWRERRDALLSRQKST